MRTIFYHLVLVGTFIYGSVVHIWYLIFNKGEKRYRYVCRVAKNWGKNLIWGAGSKVNVIYKNGSEEEIKNTGNKRGSHINFKSSEQRGYSCITWVFAA